MIDVHDLGDDGTLTERLRQKLQAVAPAERALAVEMLVETLARRPNLARRVALLSGAREPLLRQLTVRLAARLPLPIDAALLPILRMMLAEKNLPGAARLELACTLLRESGGAGPFAHFILRAVLAGLSEADALERLRRLEQTVGVCPALDAYRTRYDDKAHGLHCPRCAVQLPRPRMGAHLWDEHRLVMDGQSVREPWRLIEDWLDRYYQQPDADLLERCRELARRADPEQGGRRLQRLLLAHRIDDAEARSSLLAEAERRGDSLCPHCFALVPARDERKVKPLNVSHGRLTLGDYRVEVSERGLLTQLEMDTPRGVFLSGLEPGLRLTDRGATLFLAGPLVLLALILSVLGTLRGIGMLVPVSLLLFIAQLLSLHARLRWRKRRPAFERAVDYAWTLLAPRLHAQGFDAADSTFLLGLALVSAGHGRPAARSEVLPRLVDATETAVADGTVSAGHLGALARLVAADAAAEGADPVPLLVEQAARSFRGKLPFVYVEHLLHEAHSWLDSGQQARLRVLLCARAFEAGFQACDLLTLGRDVPALGTVLVVDEPEALVQLQLLWTLRAQAPWAVCGSAATAFELAGHADAGAKHLGKQRDLLLAAWDLPGGYVCARGLIFHDVLFAAFPTVLEVRARPKLQGGGFDFVVGDHSFWFASDPDLLVVRLEAWLRYVFHEFRLRIAELRERRAFSLPVEVGLRLLVLCPECERRLVACPGNVGVAVDC